MRVPAQALWHPPRHLPMIMAHSQASQQKELIAPQSDNSLTPPCYTHHHLQPASKLIQPAIQHELYPC
jgi:hypothetical protein